MDTMPDNHVVIELRRPSAAFANDNDKLEQLQERQKDIRDQRLDEWRGRVSRILSDR